MNTYPLLSTITHPDAVARLSHEERLVLAEELRHAILHTVAANGGHLAPSLGVVELTLALLTVFNPDQDALVWDVGHQSYAWKLLTGRAEKFDTLRRYKGLSGFPKPEESPYDHFGVGHSSTSVSAALGMALARDLAQEKHHVVAVIGDGSLTAGMAFEGLNQAGAMNKRLIVVLNDNEMSISHNVGALSLFLSRNLSHGWARRMRREVKDWLRSIPGIGEEMADYAHRTHRSLKTIFTPGMLFEALRFNYIGPVDGHDLPTLERHLRMAAEVDDQPVLLHVLTRKGKGYEPAENNPAHFHGVGRFDLESGKPLPSPPEAPPTYTKVFSKCLCDMAAQDKRIVVITAAMPEGTGTEAFKKRFPDRFVDVGICEQHAVTFAAGLAIRGFKPFVAIYSSFLQRAYDQVVHDVCLQKLPVTFCIDRAGLVGEDGPTHHGVFDISFLRHIPNLSFVAPRDEAQLASALATARVHEGPLAIRYPRGQGFGVPVVDEAQPLPVGEGEYLCEGHTVAVIAIGSQAHFAREAVEQHAQKGGQTGVQTSTLYDARWIKPLPEKDILAIAATHKALLLVEENMLAGGFSSAVLELLNTHGALDGLHVRCLGIHDEFVEHGTQKELRALTGLDTAGISHALTEVWQKVCLGR